MEETQHNMVRREVVTGGTGGHCAYCGAELSPFYYFCLQCATPYKPIEALVGRSRPMPMGDDTRIATMAPQAWTLFGTYGLVIIAAALVAMGISGATGLGESTFIVTGSLAVMVTTLIFAAIYWKSLAVQLKQFGFNQWPAWAGLGILIPLLGLNIVYHGWLKSLMQDEHFHDPMAGLFQALGLPGMILLICVFPAIMEEIAFRGLLQHWLEIAVRPTKAMLLSAILFAGLHFSLVSLPYLFLVGLLLGWMKYRTRSLYPSMLVHFLHNLTVVLIAYYSG